MKKFLVIIAVLALTVISTAAMAEVTVSGSVDIRSRGGQNVADWNSDVSSASDKTMNTQERIRINVDAKNDNVKGRVTIENDWDVWGRLEAPQANATITTTNTGTNSNAVTSTSTSDAGRLKIREGWLDFQIPGGGGSHVKVGHQFLQLGNGWFFRSMKYGSDAWLIGSPGKNTIAFVDAKFAEFNNNNADDLDAYVLLDNFKIDDTKTVGIYFARVADKQGKFLNSRFNSTGSGATAAFGAPSGDEANIDNIGLWFNGKLGPVNLQAELDYQMGKWKSPANGDTKFKGNQIIVQANMPAGPVTINAAAAMGSGIDMNSNSSDFKQIVTALDSDPHYTFVYEYLTRTACIVGMTGATTATQAPAYGLNTGFCNTTALNLGGSMDVAKWLNVSLDYWMLKATEKVAIATPAMGALSDELGNEIDVVLKFKIYDQLTWNWQIGRLMPGKAYDTYNAATGVKTHTADNVDAIQGILSYKF
jgi:hypothetical protein